MDRMTKIITEATTKIEAIHNLFSTQNLTIKEMVIMLNQQKTVNDNLFDEIENIYNIRSPLTNNNDSLKYDVNWQRYMEKNLFDNEHSEPFFKLSSNGTVFQNENSKIFFENQSVRSLHVYNIDTKQQKPQNMDFHIVEDNYESILRKETSIRMEIAKKSTQKHELEQKLHDIELRNHSDRQQLMEICQNCKTALLRKIDKYKEKEKSEEEKTEINDVTCKVKGYLDTLKEMLTSQKANFEIETANLNDKIEVIVEDINVLKRYLKKIKILKNQKNDQFSTVISLLEDGIKHVANFINVRCQKEQIRQQIREEEDILGMLGQTPFELEQQEDLRTSISMQKRELAQFFENEMEEADSILLKICEKLDNFDIRWEIIAYLLEKVVLGQKKFFDSEQHKKSISNRAQQLEIANKDLLEEYSDIHSKFWTLQEELVKLPSVVEWYDIQVELSNKQKNLDEIRLELNKANEELKDCKTLLCNKNETSIENNLKLINTNLQ
eukprot:TRINITY_DN2978_c0_g2_i1.p1 TRINITY_DN2978_c0_g2~~TRINITY_DN2978_c0_g2_i1.p1  ORF type:complete len:519 (+),score=169.63 TRINITY_DN2978_c0_g2_i1:72-1559(+)